MLLIQCYEVQPLSCTLELARMFFISYGNEGPPMSIVMQSFLKHIVARTMKQMAASGNPSDFAELISSFFQVLFCHLCLLIHFYLLFNSLIFL